MFHWLVPAHRIPRCTGTDVKRASACIRTYPQRKIQLITVLSSTKQPSKRISHHDQTSFLALVGKLIHRNGHILPSLLDPSRVPSLLCRPFLCIDSLHLTMYHHASSFFDLLPFALVPLILFSTSIRSFSVASCQKRDTFKWSTSFCSFSLSFLMTFLYVERLHIRWP